MRGVRAKAIRAAVKPWANQPNTVVFSPRIGGYHYTQGSPRAIYKAAKRMHKREK